MSREIGRIAASRNGAVEGFSDRDESVTTFAAVGFGASSLLSGFALYALALRT